MTATAALVAQTIDLDGYTLKITERSPRGADRSFYPKDRSWRITTGIRFFDFEITRDDGHVEYVNSARSIKEIYLQVGRYLRGSLQHTDPTNHYRQARVGDLVQVTPVSNAQGFRGRIIANHPVTGLKWFSDEDTGLIRAIRNKGIEILDPYHAPRRKDLADQERFALNV